jgi:hypothetical protein
MDCHDMPIRDATAAMAASDARAPGTDAAYLDTAVPPPEFLCLFSRLFESAVADVPHQRFFLKYADFRQMKDMQSECRQ